MKFIRALLKGRSQTNNSGTQTGNNPHTQSDPLLGDRFLDSIARTYPTSEAFIEDPSFEAWHYEPLDIGSDNDGAETASTATTDSDNSADEPDVNVEQSLTTILDNTWHVLRANYKKQQELKRRWLLDSPSFLAAKINQYQAVQQGLESTLQELDTQYDTEVRSIEENTLPNLITERGNLDDEIRANERKIKTRANTLDRFKSITAATLHDVSTDDSLLNKQELLAYEQALVEPPTEKVIGAPQVKKTKGMARIAASYNSSPGGPVLRPIDFIGDPNLSRGERMAEIQKRLSTLTKDKKNLEAENTTKINTLAEKDQAISALRADVGLSKETISASLTTLLKDIKANGLDTSLPDNNDPQDLHSLRQAIQGYIENVAEDIGRMESQSKEYQQAPSTYLHVIKERLANLDSHYQQFLTSGRCALLKRVFHSITRDPQLKENLQITFAAAIEKPAELTDQERTFITGQVELATQQKKGGRIFSSLRRTEPSPENTKTAVAWVCKQDNVNQALERVTKSIQENGLQRTVGKLKNHTSMLEMATSVNNIHGSNKYNKDTP